MTSLASLTLLANQWSSLLGASDLELPHSRRRLDLRESQYVRAQYEGAAAALVLRVDYSADDGATWSELVPAGPPLAGAVVVTPWAEVPDAARSAGDVLLRAVVGGALGLTVTVYYVEVDHR